ncbi:MAG: proprotein convertase P-domain-containing protein [Ignavibacteriae bacterium]|nr:proprotein convertase P-domain-containing protein [Ignavibacteriota bacterium]
MKTAVNGRPVKLLRSSGPNSFADGDNVYDGVCEVCHTTTRYHRNNGTGQPHNNAANCVTCHPHSVGFSAAGGGPACLQCHQSQMGSRRAVGPDFSSSMPHHPLTYNAGGNLNSPADNNCLICHNDYPNLHANGVVDLNPDPDNSGSQEWNGIYQDPWCMDCHDGQNPDPNYRLGGIVGPDKRSFYTTQNVHRSGTAFNGSCLDCHNESNKHTASIKFFSNFYLDDTEENMCYGCHGGAANVSNSGRYMENIRVAYATGNINSKSKHASSANLVTSDGHVFCRNCHDLHLLNHGTNILIDPLNKTIPWTGTRRAFCLRCHNGGASQLHPLHTGVSDCMKCHSFGGEDPSCSNCHLPHSSTLESLMQLSTTGKSLVVSPPSATILVGASQQFNSVLSPAFIEFTQAAVDKLAQWRFLTISGGSAGTQYNKVETPYIPLDRSIGYDPNANGGWGLITVTSSLSIANAMTIEDLNVYVNISHHYRGDIELDLTHTQTGRTVHVQAFDWGDWQHDLIFWYDSESPNDPHGNVSPRSTAESLTAFNGESSNGEWLLTIRDTWPSDNPTNPSDPGFCKVNSWALRVNGGVVGSFTSSGQFLSSYAGTGTVYSTVHNGKILPAQNGLDVSVYEDPLPLQATSALTVNSLMGNTAAAPPLLPILAPRISEARGPRSVKQPTTIVRNRSTHKSLAGRPCRSCHQALRD